ncbi:MAG: agmatine deiminase family protein [Polyangiaceae bacterium]|nr:agmatine deiminase family protein [Polyangiaceae bacterium]
MTANAPRVRYRMPAEWEPHAATWFAWPHNAWDFPGKHGAIGWVFAEAMRYLAEGERVRILVNDAAGKRVALSALRRAHVDLETVDWVICKTDRSWTRDFLPTFVTSKAIARAESKQLSVSRIKPRKVAKLPRAAAVKWRFNGWARYPNHRLDDAAGLLVAEQFSAKAIKPVTSTGAHVVLEGGAIDTDGLGTLLTTENCLVSGTRARGRRLGKAGYEALFRECLGIEQVLWLPDGIVGDDTSGHIDDFCRFVGPGRVVICEERDRRDANHQPLREARKALSRARDASGTPLEVIGLPMPRPIYFGRSRLPASYANFYIGNRAVLVPTFNDENDRQALGILEKLFGDRPVIGIHAADLVLGLGTLHCSTQQEPEG